jgi:hypothetical protein
MHHLLGSTTTHQLHQLHFHGLQWLNKQSIMKSLLSLSWLLIGTASASSALAQVYLHDSTSSHTTISGDNRLSPELAKLVFARRLGLSQYYSLSELNDPVDSISKLVQYGGPQQTSFAVNHPKESTNIFLTVQGLSDPKELGISDDLLQLTSAPHPKALASLLLDFTTAAGSEHSSLAQQPLPESLRELAAIQGNVITRIDDRVIGHIESSPVSLSKIISN